MHHEGTIIRPPSEAESILLQVARGCTHNKCTFCAAYKTERFRIKAPEIIQADLAFAAEHCRRQRHLFLCGGDALSLPQRLLLDVLSRIKASLPWVTRVGSYANARGLRAKSLDDLRELKSAGLGIAYMGLESGDDELLARIRKGASRQSLITEAAKLRQAGIKLNVTVIVGLAGIQDSLRHARLTGSLLSAIDPEQASALMLMLVPGTPLHDEYLAGGFSLPDSSGMLRELREIIAHTELSRGLFLANHASNYLPIKARLPRDKQSTLDSLDAAIQGLAPTRPEWMRRL